MSRVVLGGAGFGVLGGASLAAERGGAERRQESEAVPNREGVASGSATQKISEIYCV